LSFSKLKEFNSERFVVALPYFLMVLLFLIFTGLYPRFANFRNITGILTVGSVFLLVAAGVQYLENGILLGDVLFIVTFQ